jgi:hypothetical protein
VVTSVEVHASAGPAMSAVPAPAQPRPAPARSGHGPADPPGSEVGVARCARVGSAPAIPEPTRTYDRGSGPNDAGSARERARRVLESQQSPYPRRGAVTEAAAAGATACARLLHLEFTLRAAGGEPLDEAAVRAALRSTGLTKATVEPDLSFATSTGKACILGTITANKPAMTIAPLPRTGSCQP